MQSQVSSGNAKVHLTWAASSLAVHKSSAVQQAHQVLSMSCAGLWKASTLLMLELAISTLAAQYRLFQSVTYALLAALLWCVNQMSMMSSEYVVLPAAER